MEKKFHKKLKMVKPTKMVQLDWDILDHINKSGEKNFSKWVRDTYRVEKMNPNNIKKLKEDMDNSKIDYLKKKNRYEETLEKHHMELKDIWDSLTKSEIKELKTIISDFKRIKADDVIKLNRLRFFNEKFNKKLDKNQFEKLLEKIEG